MASTSASGTKTSVLIVGAGPAGTVLAFWLARYDAEKSTASSHPTHPFQVTLLERLPSPSTSGQVIDVEGPAQEIVTRMGIMAEIKARVTHEEGATIIRERDGKAMGTFPVGGSLGASNEIEILRPELTKVLSGAVTTNSKDNGGGGEGNGEEEATVKIRYNSSVTNIRQDAEGGKVAVDIEEQNFQNTGGKRITEEKFDIVIASDGLRSRTRDLIIPVELQKSCIRSLKAFVAFFSIPAEPRDRPNARLCQMPHRRSVFIKPLSETESSAYVSIVRSEPVLYEARKSRDQQKQKEAIATLLKGGGWETSRVIEGMMSSSNFYFEELCQVHLPTWHYGRCCLLGDTAYAPSPLTGQGTNAAILGAYLLASELHKHPNEPEEGFEAWEKSYRKYINTVQPVPLNGYAPYLVNPESSWSIWAFHCIVAFVCWLKLWKYLPETKNVAYELPGLY